LLLLQLSTAMLRENKEIVHKTRIRSENEIIRTNDQCMYHSRSMGRDGVGGAITTESGSARLCNRSRAISWATWPANLHSLPPPPPPSWRASSIYYASGRASRSTTTTPHQTKPKSTKMTRPHAMLCLGSSLLSPPLFSSSARYTNKRQLGR
jgi:hypothetical protein